MMETASSGHRQPAVDSDIWTEKFRRHNEKVCDDREAYGQIQETRMMRIGGFAVFQGRGIRGRDRREVRWALGLSVIKT